MNVWLDDEWEPRREPDYYVDPITDWIWVKNLAELEMLLESTEGRIEAMSFDYTLVGGVTGLDIMRWLHENHPNRYPRTTKVHSGALTGTRKLWEYDQLVRSVEEAETSQ